MKKLSQMIFTFVLAAMMAACANYSSSNYSSSDARTMQEARTGVVTRVRPVQISGESSGFGTVVGGVAGGVLGSQIGGGSGRVVSGVAGALLGGLAGSQIEKGVGSADGLEVTVRMDDTKRDVVIVQGNDMSFSVGERVTVVYSGSTARVTK